MPEAKNFVLLRAEYDIPTSYSSYYAGLAVREALVQKYDITDLRAQNATKESLALALDAKNPLFFLGSGHGKLDTLGGQNEEVILQKNYNESWMQDRIVFLMSCSTGKELGQAIIDAGGIAFIGYDEDFWWTIKSPFIPATDNYAQCFFESAFKASVYLLRGYTAIEAFDASIADFNKWIVYWSLSKDPAASLILENLLWDRDNMILLGEKTAKLLSAVQPAPVVSNSVIGLVVPLIGIAGIILKGLEKK